MSVIVTPSTFQVFWLESAPLPTYVDCWPLSLPPTLTRSSCTPGTVERMTHGSRAVGMAWSSVWSTTAPVSTLRVSSRAVPPETVTVASMLEILSIVFSSVFWPTETLTSGFVTNVKLWSSYVIV